MKAAVSLKFGDPFVIETGVELDAPIGGEVLIDVRASGLCHSELHLTATDFGIPLPAVFGHEVSGVVEHIGPDVHGLEVGDHVLASLIQFCGLCNQCLRGKTFECTNPAATLRAPGQPDRVTLGGEPLNQAFGLGGFAEKALVHQNQLVKVSKEIPFPQAAVLGCGTCTGAGAAVNTARVRPGETVAVIGAGGVGLNVISGARLAGASRVIVLDLQPAKLELARRFGATDVIESGAVDPVEAVRTLTSGGVDHAFEVVGLQLTSQQALRMAKIGGAAYLIGLHKPGAKIEIEAYSELIVPHKSLRGVHMGSTTSKVDIPAYVEHYLQGRLNLDDLISREINISEINEAYDELRTGTTARSVITSF